MDGNRVSVESYCASRVDIVNALEKKPQNKRDATTHYPFEIIARGECACERDFEPE